MLACGMIVQPTEITREIESLHTSTCPAYVDTDAGAGYIKGVNNPSGRQAVISELIAAELGTWFGLDIPAFAVVERCDIDIKMRDQHQIERGIIEAPVFFSLAVEGMPRDASSETFLSRLDRMSDVSRLVVFDTWIRNFDRHDPRYGDGEENSDNLLYSKSTKRNKYKLIPIDHSLCFFEDAFENVDNIQPEIEDENVYGLFPEFKNCITSEDVSGAIHDLSRLDPIFVNECVNNIPAEWGFGNAEKQQVTQFICQRAAYVVDTISERIVDDPCLPGL